LLVDINCYRFKATGNPDKWLANASNAATQI